MQWKQVLGMCGPRWVNPPGLQEGPGCPKATIMPWPFLGVGGRVLSRHGLWAVREVPGANMVLRNEGPGEESRGCLEGGWRPWGQAGCSGMLGTWGSPGH